MILYNRPRSLDEPDCHFVPQDVDKAIIVADFEMANDRRSHELYCDADGLSASRELRYPFKRIVCASWMVIRFPAGAEFPEVGAFQSVCQPDNDETDIVKAFFAALENEATAVGDPATFVTWGGDFTDIAVLEFVSELRRVPLPPQLRKIDAKCPHHLDLCEAKFAHRLTPGIHLSEYCHAQDLPGKASPGLTVAQYIDDENWKAVEEQCAADVLNTAIIAVRYLAAHGQIGQCPTACTRAIVERFCNRPSTRYVREVREWRRRKLGKMRPRR